MYTEHLRIPVGGGVLHGERLGRGGSPVLLLHGFGSCAFLWRHIAPRLADAGHTVIALDLLGFGESERPTGVSYTPAAQAGYLEQALVALRLPEVAVVGQDLGALVALMLAAEYPRQVRRVALLEPLDPEDLPGPAIRALQRTSALAALQANALFGARPLLEPLLAASVSDPARMPPRLLARYLAPFVGDDGMRELLQLASAVVLTEEEVRHLADVRAEVLLWLGSDGDDPAEARMMRWSRMLSSSSVMPVVTSRRPGTLVAEDDPEALAAALLAWLA